MKRYCLTGAIMSLVVTFLLVADASAMYNPSTGTFLNRDPGPGAGLAFERIERAPPLPAAAFIPRDASEEYTEGMNLYEYVGSAPTVAIDPMGLARECPAGTKSTPKTNYTPAMNGCGPGGWKYKLVPDKPFWMIDFRESCDAHDVGYGSCNVDKATADKKFYDDMRADCMMRYDPYLMSLRQPPPGYYGKLQCVYNPRLCSCYTFAKTYYEAVSRAGGTAYRNAQKDACDCCPEEKK